MWYECGMLTPMNYQKIYDLLCARGQARRMNSKARKRNQGFEDHHIIPKAFGGLDDASNIARLTPREHWIAHRLLYKMHPTDSRMTYAMWRLANHQMRGRLTSRLYATLRADFSAARSADMKADSIWAEYGAKGAAARDKDSWRKTMADTHGKKVMCIETSNVFTTLTKAADWLKENGYPNAKGNKIGMCCAGKLKRAYSFTWQYV